MTFPMSRPVTLIKLGGSLLDLPNLADQIRRLAKLRAGNSLLFVVGGGAAADLVRHWQPLQNLSDEQAHWLAIDAMGLNEELLQTIVPELRLVRSGPQFVAACKDEVAALLCASCFVRWGEAHELERLPRSWQVTSDSIAAWTAQAVGADELVLVKSRPLGRQITAEQAVAEGLVDEFFPNYASSLPRVSWCNARDEQLRIEHWL